MVSFNEIKVIKKAFSNKGRRLHAVALDFLAFAAAAFAVFLSLFFRPSRLPFNRLA